jgi:hypothetical protein
VSEARMAGIVHAIRQAGGLAGLGLAKRHFGVLIVMAFFESDLTGDCWPSCRIIGVLAGQHKSRVATNRTQLERMGYIIEDRPRRVEKGTAVRKYWLWNEEVFPKVPTTKCNTSEVGENQKLQHEGRGQLQHEGSQKLQHEINRTEVNEREISNAINDFPSSSLLEQAGEEDEVEQLKVKDLPKLPVMVHLLDLLKRVLKITHPRRKKAWRSYESKLRKLHSPPDLLDLIEAMDWMFTHKFWFDAFKDPRKEDLIEFFVNNTVRILQDFQMNRAMGMEVVSQHPDHSQQSLVEVEDAGSLEQKEKNQLPAGFEESPAVQVQPPTGPLGKEFLTLLEEQGITFQDTGSWDALEAWMGRTYTPTQLQEAPRAMKLVLTGEEKYWHGLMFDGKKPNLFAFFAKNLPKILRSIQVGKARHSSTATSKKEPHGPKKPNEWSGMVPD